jgi:hypothetical protein
LCTQITLVFQQGRGRITKRYSGPIDYFARSPVQDLLPTLLGKKGSRNAPAFDLRSELYRIAGIDWSQVNGIDVLTAQTVIAEAGADLSAFPSEKQFTSWLGLCPTNQHVELYQIYEKKIQDCDLQLRAHLQSLGSKLDLETQPLGPPSF